MLNIFRYSQFFIILFAMVVTFIVIGLNHRTDNSERYDSFPTPEIAELNPPVEKRVESPITSPAKTPSPDITTSPAKTPSPDITTPYETTLAFEQYKPKYTAATIHPSNYGDRYSTDAKNNSLSNLPIVVLHETTGSAMSALNTFKTSHQNDRNQVSYHALIILDGTIVYLVPSDKRAFGAGNSAFKSSKGIETVQTNPNLPSSVNNFAYHISLETPPDGRGKSNQSYHSGYTDNQYKSLAWLLALSDIPDERITTHKAVDLSGSRFDPRSFDFDKLFNILHSFRQSTKDEMSTK